MIENTRAKTSGRNRPAKLFCFLYSLVLFNAWILAGARLANILQLHGSSDNTIAHENCHTDGKPLEECDSTRTSAKSCRNVSTFGLAAIAPPCTIT